VHDPNNTPDGNKTRMRTANEHISAAFGTYVVVTGIREVCHLLLGCMSDRRVVWNLRRVCWHGTATVLLQQVESAVQEIANVVCQSCIDNVSEPLL